VSQQFFQVGLDGLGQGFQVVASLQAADQPPLAVRVGHLQYQPGQFREVFRLQAQRADWIAAVGVEAGAEQHELGRM